LYEAVAGGPLSEQAELHLLEAVSLMAAAISPNPTDASGAVDVLSKEREFSAQKALLSDMTTILCNQLQSFLCQPQLLAYADQMAPAVAHKLACLSSLAKPFSYKNPIHAHSREPLEKCIDCLIASINLLGRPFPVVRWKGITLQHRLLSSLGFSSVRSAEICLSVMLECNSDGELDAALQLLNQVIVEFGVLSIPLVNEALGKALDRLREAYDSALVGVAGEASTEEQEEDISEGGGHVKVEKEGILKQYFLLIQHIGEYKCTAALTSASNVHLVSEVMAVLLTGLSGSADFPDAGLVVRRSAIGALTSLIRAWGSVGAAEYDIQISKEYSLHHDERQIRQAHLLFAKVASEDALPMLLRVLGDGTLNLNDGGTLAFVGDIASLWWVFRDARGLSELSSYVKATLDSLGWQSSIRDELLGLLLDTSLTKTQMSQFKENFRKLIRSLHARATGR